MSERPEWARPGTSVEVTLHDGNRVKGEVFFSDGLPPFRVGVGSVVFCWDDVKSARVTGSSVLAGFESGDFVLGATRQGAQFVGVVYVGYPYGQPLVVRARHHNGEACVIKGAEIDWIDLIEWPEVGSDDSSV